MLTFVDDIWMTDVPVISADCAMTGDCMLTPGYCVGSMYPHAIPFLDLFSPCGLMDYPYW
jgi:hypothetical protein